MKTKRELILNVTTALVLPLIWVAGSSDAQAGGRFGKPRSASSHVTRTGPAGNSAVRQSSVTSDGKGNYSAGSTVTGPTGNMATRQQTGSYDPATKTYSRAGTATGPQGNQSSFNTSVQATGDGYARNATRTGPAGKTTTSTGGATYDPTTGTVNQGRTTTGPNGKSATESRSVTVTPSVQPQGI